MNTSEVCVLLNISLKSLRLYEAYEIVVANREKNNYRNYSEEDLLKLRTVKSLKELGFSLKEIKILIDNSIYGGTGFMRSLYIQLKAAERKIYELENVKSALNRSIDIMLEYDEEINNADVLNDIDKILNENKLNRKCWIDMWAFDNKAAKFDEMVRDKSNDELGLFERYDEILSEVRSRIIKYKGKYVLDIGCGTGNLCGELSDSIDILGIDQSLEMILQAKKKYNNIKFRLGNFLDKPFKKEFFDIVVTTYAFHSLNSEEKKKAINNMLEYLKNDGKIIIVDFMFLNEIEKEKHKDMLYKKKRQDLWNVIDNKYYTNLEEAKKYVRLLGYNFYYEHIVNFTWIVEIKR